MKFYEDREAMIRAANYAYHKLMDNDDFKNNIGNLDVTFGLTIENLDINWQVTCENGEVLWEEGNGKKNDFAFTFTNGKVFYEAFMEKRSPLYFIMTRKLKFSGDMLLSKNMAEFARPLQKAFQEAIEKKLYLRNAN